MTVKEWKEMNKLYERVHDLKKELTKAWTVDEIVKMLDCLVTETSEPINDSYTNGFVDGYNRALENIRFIVSTRKEK